MPQPLSNLKKEVHVNLDDFITCCAAINRPTLAAKAMNVISDWSVLETYITALFVDLVRDEPRNSATIYTALRSDSAKRAALDAVANNVFGGDSQRKQIYEAILKTIKKAAQTRNRLAHWIWGYSEDLPEAILLLKPSEKAKQDVADVEHSNAIKKFMGQAVANRLMGKDPPTQPEKSTDGIFVYTAKDFSKARIQISEAIYLVVRFRLLLFFDPKDGKLLHELLDELGIPASGGQKSTSHQNNPEAQE